MRVACAQFPSPKTLRPLGLGIGGPPGATEATARFPVRLGASCVLRSLLRVGFVRSPGLFPHCLIAPARGSGRRASIQL